MSAETKFTKAGKRMLILQFEDYTGSAELVVFASALAKSEVQVEPDTVYLVRTRIDVRDDDLRFSVLEIRQPDLTVDDRVVRVRVPSTRVTDGLVAQLRETLASHPGNSPVYLHLVNATTETVVQLGAEYNVEARSGLYAELKTVLGPDALVP